MKGKESLFKEFKEKKKEEEENKPAGGPNRSEIVWPTPQKGTINKPKTYQGRLIIDPNDNFYKSYFYHMFYSQEGKWVFVLCPKTFGMDNYCPFCAATNKLYQGNKDDKRTAYNYKRKSKHCVNWYVVKDPRDAEVETEEEKCEGKVLIYEFPDKVESKIKQEMNDEEFGRGMSVFDPGEEGVDFLLKVGATKPIQEEGPNKGKSFPDYSNSKFSPNRTALGTDDEIKDIMDQRHDLDVYLKSMVRSEESMIEIIKAEMLWELVESDYQKKNKVTRKEEEKTEEDRDETNDIPFDKQELKNDENDKEDDKENDGDDDISEEDLIKELDNL